ncbi:DUF6415 family natural product biosynthesis protein, partial [Streptomyces lydicus]|uniref:DUF6415 family natural product biosynthesis protein n=1 Tax=Streptomyces lydicus TaxID=47763 RepID=UPI0037A3D7DF
EPTCSSPCSATAPSTNPSPPRPVDETHRGTPRDYDQIALQLTGHAWAVVAEVRRCCTALPPHAEPRVLAEVVLEEADRRLAQPRLGTASAWCWSCAPISPWCSASAGRTMTEVRYGPLLTYCGRPAEPRLLLRGVVRSAA